GPEGRVAGRTDQSAGQRTVGDRPRAADAARPGSGRGGSAPAGASGRASGRGGPAGPRRAVSESGRRAATGRLRRDCCPVSAFGGTQAVGGLLHGGGATLAAGGDDAVDAGLLGAEGVQVGARQDGAFLGL